MTKHLTPLRAILYGAIVVGSFDAAYAIAFWAARAIDNQALLRLEFARREGRRVRIHR